MPTTYYRAAASTIMTVVYDLPETQSLKDAKIEAMNELTELTLRAALPGAHLVELFPWMMYIPSFLAKWKRDAQRAFKKFSEFFGRLFLDVEKRIVSPTPSWLDPLTNRHSG
jgi:hypothetical protein